MLKKFMIGICIIVCLIMPSVSVLAEENGCADKEKNISSRTISDYAEGVICRYYVSNGVVNGTVDLNFQCSYSWDEGYSGWIDVARFSCLNLQINNNIYSNIDEDTLEYHQNNGSVSQRFYFSGDFTIIISARVDEWGELDVSARLE